MFIASEFEDKIFFKEQRNLGISSSMYRKGYCAQMFTIVSLYEKYKLFSFLVLYEICRAVSGSCPENIVET